MRLVLVLSAKAATKMRSTDQRLAHTYSVETKESNSSSRELC